MQADALVLSENGAAAPEVAGLQRAFAAFTVATGRLEREYATLRGRVKRLTAELEEKNRLLAESVERERRLEAEALRQSRLAAMGETAAMLAHEIRNPLGAMELFTGLLLQDLEGNRDAQKLARQVARGIADLNHLVTNLLEFTRVRATRRCAADCRVLAEEALRYTADLRSAQRVHLERAFRSPAAAQGDPDLLRPVLLNLIRNALEAMPDGGTLRVGVGQRAGRVEVVVADTGPGVAAADQEKIFQPFYTTRSKGTGLGLAVARELVRAMGGDLGVASEPGQGATFTVSLLPA